MSDLVEDVQLSFKLLELSIRTMCYAELEKIDLEVFGRDLQLNLEEENVAFPAGCFVDLGEVIRGSQMAVSTAFGATAICLDCLLEVVDTSTKELAALRSLVAAVRNAFSHGIAAPQWYIKPHRYEHIDLGFIRGPSIDLKSLHGEPFDYSQVGGLALWYRVKDYVVSVAQGT